MQKKSLGACAAGSRLPRAHFARVWRVSSDDLDTTFLALATDGLASPRLWSKRERCEAFSDFLLPEALKFASSGP